MAVELAGGGRSYGDGGGSGGGGGLAGVLNYRLANCSSTMASSIKDLSLGQHIFEGNAASRLPQTFENFSIGPGTMLELKDERPGRKLA
ncbi:hypothetical protein HZH66_010764 [Vespula vulgaris]|uniref:Uncharacterized protein n=1 Tax=Vespula vulgaris TaxID=7454 RepID=A0A834JHK0_VESVU|nr:hypothetical protein HZH66_010764 [Vespula vulgaris]